jgi:hypothetical protein
MIATAVLIINYTQLQPIDVRQEETTIGVNVESSFYIARFIFLSLAVQK